MKPGLHTLANPVLILPGQTLFIIVIILSTNVVVESEMQAFIVGGDFASIYRYPHSAFISVDCVTKDRRLSWICGGSIVNQVLILTAAHCLEDCMSSSYIIVVVGNVHKAKGASSTGASYVIHYKYDPHDSTNDIGLVKLTTSLEFGERVRRVALMENPPYDESANIAGWGLVDEKKRLSTDFLKHIEQKVWNNKECKHSLGSLPPGTICASSVTNDRYVSEGDSGSALVIRDFIQIGIVSYKIPSVSRNLIVYTDVGYFYEWIRDNTKRMFCDLRP